MVFFICDRISDGNGIYRRLFYHGALPSVFFSPMDFIAVTDGINPSVKLDNVVVLDIPLFQNRKTKMIFFKSFLIDYLLFLDPQLD